MSVAPLLPADTVVLYGGSFDPPHMGHQMACLYLLEGCGAQAVWLLPVATHPFAKRLSPFALRLAMCEALAQPFGGRVRVLATEAELGGAGHTFDLVCALQAAHPQQAFALALGTDLAAEVKSWHRWEALRRRLPICWLGRAGYPGPQALLMLPEVSSSAIRARCAAGEPLGGWVPVAVAAQIRENALYAGS